MPRVRYVHTSVLVTDGQQVLVLSAIRSKPCRDPLTLNAKWLPSYVSLKLLCGKVSHAVFQFFMGQESI